MYDGKPIAKIIETKIAEGINILLEYKSIDCLDHFKSYMWTKMYMCTCVCMFTYTCTYGQKHIHMSKNMKHFIYVCIWTHLLCLCQQMHLGTCVYVNADMCINITCVHSYALMWVSKAVFVHIHLHICKHISHAHMYIYFNMSTSSHIHMLIYKHTHKHIQMYTHVLFMCICDNISVPKHVHICMDILIHVPYPCKHVHNKRCEHICTS